MIYYHENLSSKFQEFGIPIPLKDDRSRKVYNSLKDHVTILNDIELVKRRDLELVHTKKFLDDLESENLYSRLSECFEFHKYTPVKCSFNPRSFYQNILFQCSATCFSVARSLDTGFSYLLGGGMHHAHTDRGRGFCLLNDIVISLRKLQKNKRIKTAWIIDLDAHKGDGTAQVTVSDSSIKTLSIHMKNAWPLDEGSCDEPWFIPSTIDRELIDSSDYLNELEIGLKELGKFEKPDITIVVQGPDPYEKDELPSTKSFSLSKTEMLERDMMVFEFLKKRNIPQSYVMAGGYGESSWEIYNQFLNSLINKKLIL